MEVFKLWFNPFRQFMVLIFYSDYNNPIESQQNILVRFVPTWINIRWIVTINLQIKVYTVISVLRLIRRSAASDIWFFGFFTRKQQEFVIGYAMLKRASMECSRDCLFADADRASWQLTSRTLWNKLSMPTYAEILN